MNLTKEYYWQCYRTNSRTKGHWFPFILWNHLLLVIPIWQANVFAVVWPFIGLLWIYYRLRREQVMEHTDFVTILITLVKTQDAWNKLYLWPLDMYYVFFTRGPYTTMRREIQFNALRQLSLGISWEYGHEGVMDEAKSLTACELRQIKTLSQDLSELPAVIQINTKTAYACGVTVVAVTVNEPSEAGEPEKENVIEATTSGWVTLSHGQNISTGDIKDRGEVHTRLKLVHGPTEIFFFADVDLTEAGKKNENWLKMGFVGVPIGRESLIRVGRIPLAPNFNLFDPFDQEPVSYPRVPYTFFEYGIQADLKRGPYRIVFDCGANSSFRFDEMKQFHSVETSFRFTREFGSTWTLGVAGQFREDTTTFSLDSSWTPVPWFCARGQFYTSKSEVNRLFGGNTTLVVYPSKHLGHRLDMHSLIDYQNSSNERPHDSFRYSAGVGIRTKDNRWSATVDYEGSPNNVSSQKVLLRLIRQF